MRTILAFNNLVLLLAITQSSGAIGVRPNLPSRPALEAHPSEAVESLSNLSVSLNTPTEATITFKSQNEAKVNATGNTSERQIPHLVLDRNGVPTPSFERTLLVSLDHLAVPKSGLYARLVLETQHPDPDLPKNKLRKIQVWDETRFVAYSSAPEQSTSLDFTITFPQSIDHQNRSIQTPTDYYSYSITLFDSHGNNLREIHEEYGFLLENQWRIPLPHVLEATPGAAPNELVLYYCNMIRFQADSRDADTRIPRSEVNRYVQTELIPEMVDAFETQTNLWQLPWYSEWSNFRREEDPKTLSVALGEKGTWFHGEAASLGHAMISIRVDGVFGDYASLTDGIMSVFHHELFHNQQRNISFHFGSRGNISGLDDAWQSFSEGTAVLASSVGQPTIQLEPSARMRSYLKRANGFLGSEGMQGGGLNESYKSVPYQTAIYWRFLYEHCGGLDHGRDNPAAGMRVIRKSLETLYQGDVVDINSSADLAGALPHVLDTAVKNTPSCEFDSYEESLIQFANAIYMLRLKNGRCSGASDISSCGLYDPYHLYQTPNAESYQITADPVTKINDSIPSSYGIDLLELKLDPSASNRSLKVIFQNTSNPQDRFNIEAWKMDTQGLRSSASEPVSIQTENGYAVMDIDRSGKKTSSIIGLVITRLDPNEDIDASGEYQIEISVE